MIRAEYQAKKTVGSERTLASDETRIQPPTTYSGQLALTKLLSDSISEALTDLIGTRAREAVYDYMERKHQVARDEIPEHLNEFFKLFEQNFGVASRKVVGRVIARRVYSKLDWEFQATPSFEFADYLERIKTRLVKQGLLQSKTQSVEFT